MRFPGRFLEVLHLQVRLNLIAAIATLHARSSPGCSLLANVQSLAVCMHVQLEDNVLGLQRRERPTITRRSRTLASQLVSPAIVRPYLLASRVRLELVMLEGLVC